MPKKMTLPDASVPMGTVRDGKLMIDPVWFRALKALVDRMNAGV